MPSESFAYSLTSYVVLIFSRISAYYVRNLLHFNIYITLCCYPFLSPLLPVSHSRICSSD